MEHNTVPSITSAAIVEWDVLWVCFYASFRGFKMAEARQLIQKIEEWKHLYVDQITMKWFCLINDRYLLVQIMAYILK